MLVTIIIVALLSIIYGVLVKKRIEKKTKIFARGGFLQEFV